MFSSSLFDHLHCYQHRHSKQRLEINTKERRQKWRRRTKDRLMMLTPKHLRRIVHPEKGTVKLSEHAVWGVVLAGIAGSNPAGNVDICLYECCVFSGRGFCVGPINRPEESYRVWCVW